jgi:hypothetical protein
MINHIRTGDLTPKKRHANIDIIIIGTLAAILIFTCVFGDKRIDNMSENRSIRGTIIIIDNDTWSKLLTEISITSTEAIIFIPESSSISPKGNVIITFSNISETPPININSTE